jgi:hypothetical protein
MATVPTLGPEFTVSGTDTFVIGADAGQGGAYLTLHMVATSVTGSVAINARASGSDKAFVAIPYKKRFLNGSVADDTNVSTAITGTSIIEVNALGLDIAINAANLTGGSFAVSARPRAG